MRIAEIAKAAGAASPPRSGEVDSLAELARLIERDEAFGAVVRSGRSQERVELSARREAPSSFRFARKDAPFEHDRDREAEAPLVPSFLSDRPTGPPHDPHEAERDGPDDANALPSWRRRLRVVVAFLGLALLGCASAMAYWAWFDRPARTDDAQVIGASINPDKTMPAPQVDNGRSDERPPGQPDEPSIDAIGKPTAGDEKPAEAVPAAVPQAVPPVGVLYGPAPAKVAEVPSEPAPPAIPAGTAQNPPPDVKEPAPSQPTPGATDPGSTGGLRYVVQLSSQRSEAAAQATSRALQTKYPDAFGGRQPYIRRSDLGEKGVYYRVLTGPFAIGEAKQLCGDLKKSGADCVVQKN